MNRWKNTLLIACTIAITWAIVWEGFATNAPGEPLPSQYLWKNWADLSEPARAIWVSIIIKPGWSVVKVDHHAHYGIALTSLWVYNELTGQTAAFVAEAKHISEANLWVLSWKTGHIEGLWLWTKRP